MSKPTTCKTCQHWEKRYHDQFIGLCLCKKSPKYNNQITEADTCDKYESNDRQNEMELK